MTKSEAFLKQARADLAYYDFIENAGDPRVRDCHRLQVLQMAVEKLAKAFLYNANPEADYGHAVVAQMLNVLKTKPVSRAAGYRTFRQYAAFLAGAKPILARIEAVTPAKSIHNAEYPRPLADGSARWSPPCDDPPELVVELTRGGKGPAVLNFLRTVADRAEAIFALS